MKKFIGIDIGGTNIKAGIVDESGRIVVKTSAETDFKKPYPEFVKDIYNICVGLTKKAGLSTADISGVGIGCPGTIWGDKGVIVYSNNLELENIPFVAEFKKNWDIPCAISNDANCAALGEATFGSGRGYENSIFITLGTGVGTGIVLNGKIWEGAHGAGAEGGHSVIVVDGEQCTCGRKGCWEAYASATGLIRETKRLMAENKDTLLHEAAKKQGKISARTSFDAAKQGDAAAKTLVNRYVEYVATGIVNLINFIRPDVIMIGGGVSNEGQYFIDMLQEYADKYNFGGSLNPSVPIKRAELLNDAGLVGAATLAMGMQ